MAERMAERPSEEEIERWSRWFAVEANNRAWTLTEAESLTEAEKEEALVTAYVSAYHWSKVGNERNRALAFVLLARVHAIFGDAAPALRYAQGAADFFAERRAEPWELAFAHAVLAHAGAVAGDAVLHAEHYKRAGEIGETLGEEDKSLFSATFARIPIPVLL